MRFNTIEIMLEKVQLKSIEMALVKKLDSLSELCKEGNPILGLVMKAEIDYLELLAHQIQECLASEEGPYTMLRTSLEYIYKMYSDSKEEASIALMIEDVLANTPTDASELLVPTGCECPKCGTDLMDDILPISGSEGAEAFKGLNLDRDREYYCFICQESYDSK